MKKLRTVAKSEEGLKVAQHPVCLFRLFLCIAIILASGAGAIGTDDLKSRLVLGSVAVLTALHLVLSYAWWGHASAFLVVSGILVLLEQLLRHDWTPTLGVIMIASSLYYWRRDLQNVAFKPKREKPEF